MARVSSLMLILQAIAAIGSESASLISPLPGVISLLCIVSRR
jgi:hypothetical protein